MRKLLPIAFLLSACATTKCPTETEEGISRCRAEVSCGKGKASKALGFIFGGMGSGYNGGRNEAVDKYNACIESDISAQRSKAGVHDGSQHCVSRQIASDKFVTDCN